MATGFLDWPTQRSASAGMARRRVRRAGALILPTALAAIATFVAQVPALAGTGTAADVFDGFNRSVSSGWGSAPEAGRYDLTGSTSDYSVANSAGSIRVAHPGTARSAVLPGISLRNVDMQFRVMSKAHPTADGQVISAVLRHSLGSEYRVGLRLTGDGHVHVVTARVINGVRTPLAAETVVDGLAIPTGTYAWVRVRLTGVDPTVIRIKAWRWGSPQPDTWTATVHEASSAIRNAGAAGVRTYVTATSTMVPVPFAFDDLRVQDASNPPTPIPAGAYVVSTSGNDANAGTASAPWRTLQKAADTVPAGATVLVRSGSYAGFVMRRSGTIGSVIAIKGYPGDTRPVIQGDASTVNVIRLTAVHDVALAGLVVQGAAADKSGAGVRVENGSARISVTGSLLTNNFSYGIYVSGSTDVTIADDEFSYNAQGITVSRAGEGVLITRNLVHDQNRMVVNTPGGNDDHGAVGIAFVKTTGHITASFNQVWNNRAVSYDYGWDGGAFEIFGASHVSMLDNRMWNNKNVLETGTDGELACSDNLFARNVAYGATTAGTSVGLMLRCDQDDRILNNTFYGLDDWVFTIVNGGGTYGSTVDGLHILNNIIDQNSGKIYAFMSAMPASLIIDRNLLYNGSGGTLAYVAGKGSTASLATLRNWTGYEGTGVNANPQFVDAAGHDLRVVTGSPAIDHGMFLSPITDGYVGSAPDIGRYEMGN
jgi:hypothetical protein